MLSCTEVAASAASGLERQRERTVQAALGSVRLAAEKAGKASGILAPVQADAMRLFEAGFTLIAVKVGKGGKQA